MNAFFARYFNSGWLPAFVYMCLLVAFTITAVSRWAPLAILNHLLLAFVAVALLGLIAALLGNLFRKRWKQGIMNLFSAVGCVVASVYALGFILLTSMFGPSKDGFADNLIIPDGIVVSEPVADSADAQNFDTLREIDEMQDRVLNALASPGNGSIELVPHIPSLRQSSTEHNGAFHEYIESSPDWHVFIDNGNRFAARRWSYGGEPRNTLHGYISEFTGDPKFQTRCLLCLDCKQWSKYKVQHVEEGDKLIKPEMSDGNQMQESRIMIECGEVWVEVFEQSNDGERRVTKTTLAVLEEEFSTFLKDPNDAVAVAQARSRELAIKLAGDDSQAFRLLKGMQPGIYSVAYSLNAAEPGTVFLRAFEVTKETPLSTKRLEASSKTRMAWSTDPSERFGAKAGFMIYEGDWGKPYAARFEVWFKPDTGKQERKLAERIFRIEGWQR